MRILFILMIIISSIGCSVEDEINSLKTFSDSETVWVFAQFNVVEDAEINSYYYFGETSQNLYEAISTNGIEKGFIKLKNVKYWSGNTIHDYKDDSDAGVLIFRIQDIAKIDLLEKAPIAGETYENVESDEKEAPAASPE